MTRPPRRAKRARPAPRPAARPAPHARAAGAAARAAGGAKARKHAEPAPPLRHGQTGDGDGDGDGREDAEDAESSEGGGGETGRQAGDGGDGRVRPAIAGEKNYITPAGYKRLTEEFDFLRAHKRPEVVNALADAAAEGDRSENAEYIYRKRQLRQIDGRLRFLSKRLDHVAVVDPREQKRRDRVFFGATVSVEDEDGGKHVYRIVGQDEVDGGSGSISWRSPTGRALLGKGQGDTVTVRWHAGERELLIVAIAYT